MKLKISNLDNFFYFEEVYYYSIVLRLLCIIFFFVYLVKSFVEYGFWGRLLIKWIKCMIVMRFMKRVVNEGWKGWIIIGVRIVCWEGWERFGGKKKGM